MLQANVLDRIQSIIWIDQSTMLGLNEKLHTNFLQILRRGQLSLPVVF